MEYRFQATSISGFVQQLAVAYLTHGYRFYVPGHIPKGKDPAVVDGKLIKRYGIDVSRKERSRRKLAGRSNVHYLRYERFFVLMATKGRGRFWEEEAKGPRGREQHVRDFARRPLKAFGYSISYRNGHASVRIEREEFKRLIAYFVDLATRREVPALIDELSAIPYSRFAPVRSQLLTLLRAVNNARRTAGYGAVRLEDLWHQGANGRRGPWLGRVIYRPFGSFARSETKGGELLGAERRTR